MSLAAAYSISTREGGASESDKIVSSCYSDFFSHYYEGISFSKVIVGNAVISIIGVAAARGH
jgi:hypothetical protein